MEQTAQNTYILSRTVDGRTQYMPLYVHSFRLIAPRKLLEAQLLNQQYHRYEDIDSVPDRLRWCRHSCSLMQSEVADYAGVSRAVYTDIESGMTQHFPIDMAQKLSELYDVPITDFLDEFNQFLLMDKHNGFVHIVNVWEWDENHLPVTPEYRFPA